GTLKGMNRTRFTDAIFKGRAVTLFSHWMMWGGSFPVVVPSTSSYVPDDLITKYSGRVSGELYSVSQATLDALDAYEGVPDFYNSQPVALKMEDGSDALGLIYIGEGVARTLINR